MALRSRRRRAGLGTTTRFTVVLLGVAVPLTLLLGYEAWQAERQQRSTTERVLRDYARTAAWIFLHRLGYSLVSVPHGFDPISGLRLDRRAALPALDLMLAAADTFARCSDRSADRERYYFRVDFRNDGLSLLGGGPRPDVGPLLVRTVRDRIMTTRDQDWFLAPMFRTGATGPRSLLYVAVYDGRNAPLAAYGFETCDTALWESFFAIVGREPLLPPVLTGKISNDSLLSIDVTALGRFAGHYRSPVQYASAYTAELADSSETGGKLNVKVSLRPDLAERLAVGGLPPSRVPILLVLMALTAGIIGLTIVQLRREQELVRLRGDFTSSVSHELRTPVAEILLYAETLDLDRFPTEDARRGAVRVIAQEARRLARIIENVLHFSRAERRMLRLSPEPLPLRAALEEIVAGFAPLAEVEGVTIVLECEPGLAVQAHRGSLHQVVLNLLDNALKYGGAGRAVTLRVRRAAGMARIEIEDRGPGVPATDRELVWQPFTRLAHADDAIAGSGIGLAVVRDIVTAHRGRCWVEDGTEGGARFVVEWPTADLGTRMSAEPGP